MTEDWVENKDFEKWEKRHVPPRTDAELVMILSDGDVLRSVIKEEGPEFFGQLFTRMVKSKKFRDLADKAFSNLES